MTLRKGFALNILHSLWSAQGLLAQPEHGSGRMLLNNKRGILASRCFTLCSEQHNLQHVIPSEL